MSVTIATVLAGLLGLGIILVGARYLLAPQASASTFGLREWPPLRGGGSKRLAYGVHAATGVAVLAAAALFLL